MITIPGDECRSGRFTRQVQSEKLFRAPLVIASLLLCIACIDFFISQHTTGYIVLRGGIVLAAAISLQFAEGGVYRVSVVKWSVLLGFGIQGGLYCLFPIFWDNYENNFFNVSGIQVSRASQVTLLAQGCFLLGAQLVRQTGLRSEINEQISGVWEVAALTLYAMLWGLLPLISEIGPLGTAISRQATIIVAMALVWSATGVRIRSISPRMMLIIAYAIPLCWAVIDIFERGQRGSLIGGYLPLVFVHILRKQKIPPGIVALGCTTMLALILLLPAINNFRSQGLTEIQVEQFGQEIRSERSRGGESGGAILWIVNRLSYIPTLAVIVDSAGESVPRYNGLSYISIPLWVIPRAWWPQKPTLGSSGIIASDYFGWNGSSESVGAGVGASVQGEAYANWGIPGVILVCILLGCVFAGIDRLIIYTCGTNMWFALLIMYYGVSIIALEQCLDHLLLLTKWQLIALVPLFLLFTRQRIQRNIISN